MQKSAKTDHPVDDMIKNRWSPRAFAERSVEPEKIRSVLEAARWAPSSFNEQPWNFIIATPDQKEEFQRLLSCLVEGNQSWAKRAPLLMITVAALKFARTGQPNRHAFHDVGLAIGNLTTQATLLGLAVHQMAGILPGKAREVFHIPDNYEAVTGVAIGYAGDPQSLPEGLREKELAPRSRKPQESFIFSGDWERVVPLLTKPE
jgi:nitroreductase